MGPEDLSEAGDEGEEGSFHGYGVGFSSIEEHKLYVAHQVCGTPDVPQLLES